MATATKKNEKKSETPDSSEVEASSTDSAANALSAFEDLDSLEVAYKVMKKELRQKEGAANKEAAIDLVADAADDLIDDLLSAVDERGMKFTNFTIRYAAKNDTGKGVADSRGISTVIGAVRMSVEDIEARDEQNLADYTELLGDTTDEKAEANERADAVIVLDEWLYAHPSFTHPVEESASKESA